MAKKTAPKKTTTKAASKASKPDTATKSETETKEAKVASAPKKVAAKKSTPKAETKKKAAKKAAPKKKAAKKSTPKKTVGKVAPKVEAAPKTDVGGDVGGELKKERKPFREIVTMACREQWKKADLFNMIKETYPDDEVTMEELNNTQVAFKVGKVRIPEEGYLTVKNSFI